MSALLGQRCPLTPDIPFDEIKRHPESIPSASETVFICRRGNDSLIAADILRKKMREKGEDSQVKDIIGGLVAWAREVDPEFPVY